jgi:hypothetical protein
MKKKKLYVLIFCCIIAISIPLFKHYRKKSRNLAPLKPIIKVKLTNAYHGNATVPSPIQEVLQERYDVKVDSENYDIILDSVYDGENGLESIKNDKAIKIFYTPEAELPTNFDDYDLVTGFNNIDHPKFIRLPYYRFDPRNKKISSAGNNRIDLGLGKCNPRKEVFACMLVSNGDGTTTFDRRLGNGVMICDGVTARDSIFKKLSEYKLIESGGRHLNNIGDPVPYDKTNQWFSRCKFIIAYENQSYDGYITEKPFNAYYSGAIPIYYAAENTMQDINRNAVIYAKDFKSEDELVEYIKKVDNDDDLYCKIWNQNLVVNPDMDYTLFHKNLRDKIFEVIDNKLKK